MLLRGKETIRWGILGCGDVCEVKSGPGFQKAEGSALVAVQRRTPGLAKDFARRHGVAKFYTDVDALLDDPEVDAVYVATPPSSHKELAMKALKRGKPTLIEKPMARNAQETREICEAFKKEGVPLFSAYYRRGQERFKIVRAKVVAGVIGRLTGMRYTMLKKPMQLEAGAASLPWRLEPEISGGGLFLDVGSHVIDICEYIAGGAALEDVCGTASRSGVNPGKTEDSVSLSATVNDGSACVTAHFCFCAQSTQDELIISGTKGEIKLSIFGSEPVRVQTADGGMEEIAAPKPEHVHMPLIQTIVDELRLGLPQCPSKGDNALRCAAAMDAELGRFYERLSTQ